MIFLKLFAAFARVGLLTFGGGYAMIPMLEREIVDRYGWATREELMDYYAVGQCTPGVIAVNTGTFIGYKVAGKLGGVVATLGVIFPSFVIITVIAGIIQNFADFPVVKNAFAGIRVAVVALVLNAVLKLLKSSAKDKLTWCIFAVTAILATVFSVSPVIFVLAAGLLGVCVKVWKEARK